MTTLVRIIMKSLFKLELKKALTNKMFILSTVIATILENRILLFKMSRQMLWTQTELKS